MSTLSAQFVMIVTLLLLFQIKIEGDSFSPIPNDEAIKNSTNTAVVVEAIGVDEESPECGTRPWICSNGQTPPRMVCCRNRCVDVTNNATNCGFCGVICPLIGNWQCCNGLCANIDFSPFNCGACGRRCPIGISCVFGRCPFTPEPPTLLSPGLLKQSSTKIPNN